MGIRLTDNAKNLLGKLKYVAYLGVVVIAALGVRYAYLNGYIPGVKPTESVVPTKVSLDKSVELEKSNVPQAPLPTSRSSTKVTGPEIRVLVWAWNSQMGLMLANGGKQTTQNSIMEKHGVKVKLTRQDDAEKMKADLAAFAQEHYNGNKQPTGGAHFVQIMGDGSAQFAESMKQLTKRLGPQYAVRGIGSGGKSFGEDKMMGPQAWKDNPKLAKGGTVCGYLRDGDWNIAIKWAGDWDIRNNPDETTYDPEAMNWIAANNYIDAVTKYITGYTETRNVVNAGKPTGGKQTVQCDAVVTWTPGDVKAAKEKGGLVNILSTKENDSQMPQIIIGVDAWMKENSQLVTEYLAAVFEGSDQVKLYPEALKHAAKVSAEVYGEEKAEYWEKYYKGTVEPDKLGVPVELGGSAVHNLADNLNLFGLRSGRANAFAATYTVFGDLVKQQYPKLVPSYPSADEFLDLSYLKAAAQKYPPQVSANEEITYREGDAIQQKTGEKSWDINFVSGSAQLTPEGERKMEEVARNLVINNFSIALEGHTDNQGDDAANQTLSEQRADTVKKWLESRFPGNFPKGRIQSPRGFGETKPVADNNTAAGRARNRRVTIVLGIS